MINRAESGASTSVEVLWKEFSAPLRAFLRRRTRTDADADDLLQEVFYSIHRRLTTLRHPEKLQGWVYQIARNAVIDHYRGRRDHAELKFESDPGDRGSVDAVDLTPSLRRFIAQLPPIYRAVLVRHEFDGIGLDEIAKDLGITLTATKSRVRRGRMLLRKMLDECCRFEFDRRGRVIEATPRQKCECSRQKSCS